MTEWDHKKRYDLSVVLATLYPMTEESRRIADAAGLNMIQISFHNQALTNWFNILKHAEPRGKIEALIDVALSEDPDNPALKNAKAGAPPRMMQGPEPSGWRGAESAGQLEKIIGAKSTLVDIRYLELGLIRSKPVVRIARADGSAGSGFLIKGNILITNHHVIDSKETAESAVVQFNYQKTLQGLEAAIDEYRLRPGEFFRTSPVGEDDWTAVKVDGDPQSSWGAIELSPATLAKDDRVNIIQHAGGGPKQISVSSNVVVFVDDTRVQYLTDTLPGSSGSPVFDEAWNVVALHHSGGWLAEPNAPDKRTYYRNEGIRIDRILDGLAQNEAHQ